MTEETIDADPAATAELEGPTSSREPVGEPTGNGEPEPRSHEAKKYREQRNEARAERDAVTVRAEAMEWREVDRIAGRAGAFDSALEDIRERLNLDDLRGDDGVLNAELVSAAVAAVKGDRGHWFAHPDLDQGPRGGTPVAAPQGGFGAALQRAAGGSRTR